MILEEETYKRFGYYPPDLSRRSHKRILAKCDDCEIIREVSKDKYRCLCRKCARKGERNANWKGGEISCFCLVCKKEFFVKPSRIKRGWGKYCSENCKGIAYAKDRRGAKSWAWKGGNIKRICIICKKEFSVSPSTIKRGGGKYCSRKCEGVARSMYYVGDKSSNWKGGPLECKCQECNKIFFTRQDQIKRGYGKYCSSSCAAKARRRNAKPKKTQPEIIFEDMCKKYSLPFKFVGDGAINIGNANPDFIHSTRKLVCEVFGDFWHSPLLNRNLRSTATLEGRRKQLKAEGYKLIVIWESDLKRKDAEQFVLYTLARYKIYPSTI